MCGLVGTLTNNAGKMTLESAFRWLLYLDVFRGEHSTGAMVVSKPILGPATAVVKKSVGSPSEFYREHGVGNKKQSLSFGQVICHLGHNRFATQGAVNAENAHPFEFEHIIGAHNGTMDMKSLEDFHGYQDYEVDSQIIYAHLNHTRDIKEVWKAADGAMALTWWDKAEESMNFIRNTQRPLFMAFTENDQDLLWASEAWMLQVAASKAGVKIQDPFEILPNRHYVVKRGLAKLEVVYEDLSPFVPKPTAYTYYKGSGGGYYDLDDWYESYRGRRGNHRTSGKVVELKPSHNRPFIIREAVDAEGNFIAYTEDGQAVQILPGRRKYEDLKEIVLGRQMSGYYTSSMLRPSQRQGIDLFCLWDSTQFLKLKEGYHLLNSGDNGFTISGDGEDFHWGTGKSLHPNKFFQTTKEGCNCCQLQPLLQDSQDLFWVTETEFYCSECASLPYVQDLIQDYNSARI